MILKLRKSRNKKQSKTRHNNFSWESNVDGRRSNRNRMDIINDRGVLFMIMVYRQTNRSYFRKYIFKQFRNNSYNASVSDFIKEFGKYLKENPFDEGEFIMNSSFGKRVDEINGILKMLQRNWNINKLISEDGGS